MESLFLGISVCIGLQFLLLSFFLFYKSLPREKLIGFLSIILAISFLQTAFHEYVLDSFILKLIFAGKKFVLIPPLLYLYINSEIIKPKTIKKHFILPISYIVAFYFLQLVLTPFYLHYRSEFKILNFLLVGCYFIFYLVLGHRELKKELANTLYVDALDKYKKFFYSFNIVEILIVFSLAITLILPHVFTDNYANMYESTVSFFSYFSFIWGVLLLFFFLSESHFFKSRTTRLQIKKSAELLENSNTIETTLHHLIIIEKRYKDPEFDISSAALKIGQNPRLISEYFREVRHTTFNAYLTKLRLNEFKRLSSEHSSIYDIDGLLSLSGFKSRSTFYRAFKKHFGMTPKQYLSK